MKNRYPFLAFLAAVSVSCSINEVDKKGESPRVFYAQIEVPSGMEQTKVYVDNDLSVLWHADDRVSIFDKNTFNQEYRFTGKTGANAGSFEKVDNGGFITGNAISSVYSVYPFKESTEISNQGVLSVDLPATQSYAENSFGLEANTMVSVTSDNLLMYKNIGGYLRLSLYGNGVSVSSITLKGNNGEKLAGKASISMPIDGMPTVVMADNARTEITLICESPVLLGATEEECTAFWFVVPPVSFDNGFTITVNESKGGVFEKSTSKSITIERNKLIKMSSMEVKMTGNIICYTSSDGNVVTPYSTDGFGASIVSNEYVDGKGIITFDGDVTSIGDHAFFRCKSLTSITIPPRATSIENSAFWGCWGLSSVDIPNSVSRICENAFKECPITSITLPNTISRIEGGTFAGCSLTSIIIPSSVTSIGDAAFDGCSYLSTVSFSDAITTIGKSAFWGCDLSGIVLPEALLTIDDRAFGLNPISDVVIPASTSYIGINPFMGCTYLSSITVDEKNKVYDSRNNCNAIIESASNTLVAGCKDSFIPESICTIGQGAFSRLSTLTSIIIPDSVTSILASAFTDSGLTAVTVPSSVTSIGHYAFDSESLMKLTVLATEPPVIPAANIINGSNGCVIYVPEASVEVYKTAVYWSLYDNCIQPISSVPVPEAIDLGLPSGVKWASFNLGASKPEESGYYLAWGENETKDNYLWDTYRWGQSSTSMLKYNTNSAFGVVDNVVELELQDDAAHMLLGGGWRIPTEEEFNELINNCSYSFTKINNILGFLFTSSNNGESIFFPATSYASDPPDGYYWSSSLNVSYCYSALRMELNISTVHLGSCMRYYGSPIRPVCSE